MYHIIFSNALLFVRFDIEDGEVLDVGVDLDGTDFLLVGGRVGATDIGVVGLGSHVVENGQGRRLRESPLQAW